MYIYREREREKERQREKVQENDIDGVNYREEVEMQRKDMWTQWEKMRVGTEKVALTYMHL